MSLIEIHDLGAAGRSMADQASWGLLGTTLGQSWLISGRSWATWCHLGAILGPSWGHLGLSWAILRRSWGDLGSILKQLGPTCDKFGHLG